MLEGLEVEMGSAQEWLLYEADWARRRAEWLKTAAIVTAALGQDDLAKEYMHKLTDVLFPENVSSRESFVDRGKRILDLVGDKPIPFQPPPGPEAGIHLLPKIDIKVGEESGFTPKTKSPQGLAPRPAKKPWRR